MIKSKPVYALFAALITFLNFSTGVMAANPNLKYFGYFVAPPNPSGLRSNINVNVLGSAVFPAMAVVKNQLAAAKDQDQKVIINLTNYLIMQDSTGYSLPPDSDLTTKMAALNQNNMISDYKDTIYSFMMDEMLIKGLTNADIKRVTGVIRRAYPVSEFSSIQIQYNEGGSQVANLQANSMGYINDIGFDWYFTNGRVEPYTITAGWDSYMSHYNELKTLISEVETTYPTKQKMHIWIIPDGGAAKAYPERMTRWPAAFEKYYELAQSDPYVTGMLIWLYPESASFWSVQSITSQASPYFNLNYTNRLIQAAQSLILPGDFNGDGYVNYADYIVIAFSFGNPYTIYDYNSLITNYGK